MPIQPEAATEPPAVTALPEPLRPGVLHYWEVINADPQTSAALSAVPAAHASASRVWACSDFVARACTSRAGLLAELLTSGDLMRPYQPGGLHDRVRAAVQGAQSEEELKQRLRVLRLRETVRIAWRDLAGWAELDEVMATLSELADACLAAALDWLYAAACRERGTPRDSAGRAVGLSVFGLGKLGGGELNFSSDIDLLFGYLEDGETDADRPLSNHEFFIRLCRRLIGALDEVTAEGFVFRVDMRLRPNGNSGPLVLSFDATEHYYQTHGRDWERYALIKARVVAGNLEAGEQLLARLRPFVYRKYLDYGAFEAIRSMKAMIERELERKRVAGNIKLGRGGIREIEFITQSFQLIRGGRERGLQTNRLYLALERLIAQGALSAEAAAELAESYRFLRRVEHRLQMMADLQTHILPGDDTARARLVLAIGSGDWDAFMTTLQDHTDRVHGHFQNVFASPADAAGDPSLGPLTDLWRGSLDAAAARQLLTATGYTAAGDALRVIRPLREGKLYQASSKYGRERLDRLLPVLIRAAAGTEEPIATLTRLLGFVEAVGRRSAYLALLLENPLALSQLVALCGASAWISTWLSRYPLLLDELLDPISSERLSTRAEIGEDFVQQLDQVEDDDLGAQMETLREVHHAQVLRIAAADVSTLIDWTEVGRRLCVVAEEALTAAVAVCQADLRPKLGTPSAAGPGEPAFGIVAYGKLGSLELGYNSDLDIVFLHHGATEHGMTTGGIRSVSNGQYYGRLAQRLVHVITTRTAAGALYEIDMRLRPSGRAGLLVTNLNAFRSYQLQQAWTWEQQALVRARMVTGPAALRQHFEQVRHEVLVQDRDGDRLRREVAEMRDKMIAANDRSDSRWFDLKQGRGGIIDIEFIVQYYVLRWAHEFPTLTTPRNNIDLVNALSTCRIIDESVARQLSRAYHDYLAIEHRHKLAEQPALVEHDSLAPQRELVMALWRDTLAS